MKQILKASAIVGTGSAVQIVSGIIKGKIMAVLLGPSGIGLFGLLQSVLMTASTFAGMGLSNSGVRQVTSAHADGGDMLSRTRLALRISSLCFGILGAVLLFVFREPMSRIVTGSDNNVWSIAWLGVGVFASVVSSSQIAFLNGYRLIGDLARINIFSSIVSMLTAVISIWMLKERGIVVAIVSFPLMSLFASWWFSSRIESVKVNLSWVAISEPLRNMLSQGVVFMLTALMTVGTQLVARMIITDKLGMAATGHFQAAWSISMLYLGFVLGAMGTDYYPRLTAVSNDLSAVNRMVNEQTEVVLLLAGPVILGMYSFAPQIVGLLYSDAFREAVFVLRWQVLGDFFKCISWTLAFILLAQGRSRIYFFTELTWNVMYILLVFFGLKIWGIEAAGIAFFVSYMIYLLVLWSIAYRSLRFVWSKNNLRLMSLLMASAMLISLSRLSGQDKISLLVGTILTAAIGYYSMRCTILYLKRDDWAGLLSKFKVHKSQK